MTSFKWLVRLRILANLVLAGYFMIYAPVELMKLLDIGGGERVQDWIRVAGILYIFITMGYLPSAYSPLKTKVANLFPLLAPILPAILFVWLGGKFMWFAIYEFVFLLLLNFSHRRGWIAELQSKP